MSKKSKTIEKTLHFNCSTCQKIYQLIETHYSAKFNSLEVRFSKECSSDCQSKWQEILHEYYQEKVLGYIRKQEEWQSAKQEEEEEEPEEN